MTATNPKQPAKRAVSTAKTKQPTKSRKKITPADQIPLPLPAPEIEQVEDKPPQGGLSVPPVEFLEAVFHALPDGGLLWTAAVTGPLPTREGEPKATGWKGRPVRYAADVMAAEFDGKDAYFNVSSLKPGSTSREKKNFAGLHCMTIDDVGNPAKSNLTLDTLPLPPSWATESSPGNYQVGYILDTPVLDVDIADGLFNRASAAGWGDKGADGPASRYMRLPCGINSKTSLAEPFPVHLVEWHPERRYTAEEILEKLPTHPAKENAARRDWCSADGTL